MSPEIAATQSVEGVDAVGAEATGAQPEPLIARATPDLAPELTDIGRAAAAASRITDRPVYHQPETSVSAADLGPENAGC